MNDEMDPVWKAADALKHYVFTLILTDEERYLLLETIYLELRDLYLQEDQESGYEHIKGLNAELDRLTNVLYEAMEGLYEMKDVLDLEEILERLRCLWLPTPIQ